LENKLYLNQGGFKFLDITDKAGVAASKVGKLECPWRMSMEMDGWTFMYADLPTVIRAIAKMCS